VGMALEKADMKKPRAQTSGELAKTNHYLLFNQTSGISTHGTNEAWLLSSELRALRGHPQNVHTMYRDRHEALHDNVSHVPLLSKMMALRTLATLDSLPEAADAIGAINNLQQAIDRAKKSKYSDSIERGIANVAIIALDMQREFFYPEAPATIIDLGSRLKEK
jgi:hypothetical protein